MTVPTLDEMVRILKDDYKESLFKIQQLKAMFKIRAVDCEYQETHPSVDYITDAWQSCKHESYPFPRAPVCCLDNCPLGKIQ